MSTSESAVPAAAAAFSAAMVLGAGLCSAAQAETFVEYPDFYTGEDGASEGIVFETSVSVLTPAYGSYVKGPVTVVFRAPGMRHVKAFCWGGPEDRSPWGDGRDVLLAELEMDGSETAEAEFVFPADAFPNGPTTIRIHAKDDTNRQDICELQLFNLGGFPWRQGLPKEDPPGAKGMALVFADDFDGPLSISPDGRGARYAAHKTGGGDFSGWQFSDPVADGYPFSQRDTWLRIHASKPFGGTGRSGILSSLRADGTGVCVPVPSYFECRFVAHSAPGSWPAFWTLTRGTLGMDPTNPLYEERKAAGTDELDIIEAYGGYGKGNPNSGGFYSQVTHFWGQERPAWANPKLPDGSDNPDYRPTSFRTDTLQLGERSSWSWTPHTYGLAITETDTVYYFDNIEVGRHPTGPVSLSQPAWFLINYAIGGISGWKIDMERYGNRSDMWVDFVRVYSGRIGEPTLESDGFVSAARPAQVTISSLHEGAVLRYTLDGSEPTEQSPRYTGPIAVAQSCTVTARAFPAASTTLLPSPAAKLVVRAAPGVDGTVGISFVDVREADRLLAPADVAGYEAFAQGNWNQVDAKPGKTQDFVTSDGRASPVRLEISGDAQGARAEPWGFSGNDGRLQTGCVQPEPALTLSGIPYKSYDVLVYLTAGPNSSEGNVRIQAAPDAVGTVPEVNGYAFSHGWLGGQRAIAASLPGTKGDNANLIRFSGCSASSIVITLEKTGWWTGIAAIQIIPTGTSTSQFGVY